MTKSYDRYTYRVTWSQEDEEYVGLCAEFPSLSWLDSSHEDSLKGIRKMTREIVEELEGSGESIPEPLATRTFSGRFNLRIPPDLHRELVVRATETGISLNRLASDILSRAY